MEYLNKRRGLQDNPELATLIENLQVSLLNLGYRYVAFKCKAKRVLMHYGILSFNPIKPNKQ